jgi:hypothetical protein
MSERQSKCSFLVFAVGHRSFGRSQPVTRKRKSRTGATARASWSGFELALLKHIKPRQFRSALRRHAGDLICSSEKYLRDYFFFLPVFFAFFAFFAFLAMLPSSPKVGSMQVGHRRADDSVHHNRKIDTACFEQGKRRALASARQPFVIS